MDKNIFNTNNNKPAYGKGYVYSLQYRIVWCTKYRRQVLKDQVEADLKNYLYQFLLTWI